MKNLTIYLLILIFLLAGCTLPLASQPTATALPTLTEMASMPQPSQTVAETVVETAALSPTPEPSTTFTPEPTATASITVSPSPTTFVPFAARVWANNVNMRTNPGYLFSVVRLLGEGAEFTVLGKAPGGEWLFVRRPDAVSGWVFTLLVESEYDLQAVPLIQPTGVQTITGRLLTESGEPVNGIHFTITQGSWADAPRNDANTDENGEFIAFMPLDSSGEWTVSYAAISCKSIVMDADCNIKPGYSGSVFPEFQDITLPYNDPLEFVWR